jgi:hypothetical protein
VKTRHRILKKLSASFALLLLVFSCNNHSSEENNSTKNKTVTYADNIAGILFKNCTSCHRPMQAGPFNLLSYADAKRNANKIKFVTQTHYMPPWPADAAYTHFVDERILSANEIEQIKIWVDKGCIAGDTNKIKTPVFYDGSFFGKPDVVLKMQEAIPVKGNGTDHFYMIKVAYELKNDTFVRFIEFMPQQRKLVHHVNGHLISYEDAKKKTVFKGKSYYLDIPGGSADVYKMMGLLNDDGTYPMLTPNTVYYLPGYTPPVYPENIGGYLLKKRGAFFLKNMHYGPSAKDCVDSSTINIFYGPKPVRPIQETQLGTFGIAPTEPALAIPANTIKTFKSQWTTPADLSILSVNPHMHLLGKTFLAYAITPQEDTIRLIKINKWDFKWQYYYTFKHPVKIPVGSTLYAYGTYDNTDKNPYNPFHPPRDCKERNDFRSMGTTEEMFQFIFTYLPYRPGDEQIDLGKKPVF